jgi:methylamine dehydrogenase accessory protein MauD
MNTFLVISSLLLWLAVLFLGFLVLGALRAMELVRWQLEQLQATMPTRKGRGGLKPGKKAPAFALPSTAGSEIALADYAGRRLLLVFVQTGCGPCHAVVPYLNKLHRGGELQVLAINNADPEAGRKWASEVEAAFPVLVQENWAISKRYEVFATPFAFLVDEQGVIASSGIVNKDKHIGFVLERRAGAKHEPTEAENGRADAHEPLESQSVSQTVEVNHD